MNSSIQHPASLLANLLRFRKLRIINLRSEHAMRDQENNQQYDGSKNGPEFRFPVLILNDKRNNPEKESNNGFVVGQIVTEWPTGPINVKGKFLNNWPENQASDEKGHNSDPGKKKSVFSFGDRFKSGDGREQHRQKDDQDMGNKDVHRYMPFIA